MNLFDLFARIFLDTSDYEDKTKDITKDASGIGGKLGKAFGTATKVIGAGVAVAAAGVATLTTNAIKGYADFEQLVGGVETLFGAGGQTIDEYAKSVGKSVNEAAGNYSKLMHAQEEVMANARQAFSSAGLSANEYMETVTSFSASLISSLGGDTQKAAQYADRAIVDMSDNANKMGTSMEAIQNAYQGFAKQNYTINNLMSAA